jgi:hypothetical protein
MTTVGGVAAAAAEDTEEGDDYDKTFNKHHHGRL